MSTASPLVSYCIPAYNHAQHVRACLESVLAQSYPNIEVVVIDDCSTDSTYEVIQSLGDERVRAYRNPVNVGPGETVNRCMQMARGEFIAVSGSDDVHLPHKTSIQIERLLAAPHVGAIFSTPEFIGPHDEPLAPSRKRGLPSFPAINLDREAMFQRLLGQGNFLLAPSAIIRKSVVQSIGFFDPGLIQLQDYDYWLRIAVEHDLLVLDQPLVRYRMMLDGSNLSSENDASRNRHHFELSIIFEKLAEAQSTDESMQSVDARRSLMQQALAHSHSRDVLNLRARLLYEEIRTGVGGRNAPAMQEYRKLISDNAIFSDRNPLVDLATKLLRHSRKYIGGQS
ncbi:MAG: glycosyltransferase family 2 protein [Comamonadaceae bacterium]|nr:MAG: glycosyltransferase family 2 protein [Comamonadaceae bacterium]